MSPILFPRVDETILARRDSIVEGLRAILPPECVIADESGRRAFETDALTAYRRVPLAVVLPRSTEEPCRVRSVRESMVPLFEEKVSATATRVTLNLAADASIC